MNAVAKLQRELIKANDNVGKYISRPGVHYSWFNATALDAEIQAKRDFAVQWRKDALQLADDGELTERSESYNKIGISRKFRVFSVNGHDRLAVCTNAGSNYIFRILRFGTGHEYANWSDFKKYVQKG